MEAALKIIAFSCFGYNVSLVRNSIHDSSALQKSGHVTANKFIYCEGCLFQIQNWKFNCRCSRAVQGSKRRFTAVVAYSALLQQIILFRKEALLLANQDVVRNLKRCFVSLNENTAGHVRVGIFLMFSEICHKSKTDWNWTECALLSTVICYLLPLPLRGWIKIRIFKVFSSKGQLLLPPVILFDFLKMSQSFSVRIWCRLNLSLSSSLQDKKTYCFTGKASLHNRRLPYNWALPSLLLDLQGVMLLLSKVIQA